METVRSRSGFTLLELIVTIAIIAILLALLVCAVVRVRESASIAQSQNNMRQIVLGVHNFASSHQQQVPAVGDGPSYFLGNTIQPGKKAPAIFVQILPYLEAQNSGRDANGRYVCMPVLLSPADPTASAALASNSSVSSYAANATLFDHQGRLSAMCSDGTSNTIAFAEHYAFDCKGIQFPYDQSHNGPPHRASFADIGDVLPVTEGTPPLSFPSAMPYAPVSTFQVAPRTKDCVMTIAQTPHTSGMIVGLADGSVRQLAPSISTSVFWSAVTPRGGEVLTFD